MMPSIVLLFWLQHRARKMGLVTIASSGDARAAAAEYAEKEGQAVAEPGFNNAMPAVKPKMGLGARIWLAFHELDAFGLLLLGFGWSLVRPKRKSRAACCYCKGARGLCEHLH